jgi:membrane protein
MKLKVPRPLELAWLAIQAWFGDNAGRMGASIAYYTLFAIAPILLIVIAVAGAVFGEEAVRGEIVGQLDNLIGGDGARLVQQLIESASKPKQGTIAAIIGTVTFLLAATGVFLELQAALNAIWRVKAKPGVDIKGYLKARAKAFGVVVSIGFLLMVSLAVSAGLSAASSWVSRRTPVLPLLLQGLNVVVSLAVITALFAVMYRMLPDVKLRWRDVVVGAFVTAVLFTVGKQLIGLYIGQSAVSSAYGAAGSVVVLLVWVYYSSQIVLLGAEFTRVYTQREQRRKPQLEEFATRDPDAAKKATKPVGAG